MGRFRRSAVTLALFGVCSFLAGLSTAEAALTATLPSGAAFQDGMTLGRIATVTFLPDDPGAQLTVFLDGVFFAGLGKPFLLSLDLVGATPGEHVLHVDVYGVGPRPKESWEVKFKVSGEVSPELAQEGMLLETRLPAGEAHEVQEAAISKVTGPDEGEFPPILKYLNRAVKATLQESLSQVGENGLPTLRREIQGATVWTFVPLEDRYGLAPISGKEQAEFQVTPSGVALTGPQRTGLTGLGILPLEMPNSKVRPGEGWASEMGVLLDLTNPETKVAIGNHVFSGVDWVEGKECAVIESHYSLDGPLRVNLGDQPFLLSRVAAAGTRRSYYDPEAGRFLMVRDRVSCAIFLTQEEKDQLEALLKPSARLPQVATGTPAVGYATASMLAGSRAAAALGATPYGARPQAATTPSPSAMAPPGPMSGPGGMGMPAGAMGEEEGGQQEEQAMPMAPGMAGPSMPTVAPYPGTPLVAGAAVPMALTQLLGPDGKLRPDAAQYLRGYQPAQLASWAQAFPTIFSNDLRQQLGLPTLEGQGEMPLVEPAALVVTYELDLLSIAE